MGLLSYNTQRAICRVSAERHKHRYSLGFIEQVTARITLVAMAANQRPPTKGGLFALEPVGITQANRAAAAGKVSLVISLCLRVVGNVLFVG